MKAGRNCLGRRRKTTQTDIKPRRLRAAAAGLNRRAAHPVQPGETIRKSRRPEAGGLMPDREVRHRARDGSPKGRDRVSGLGSRQPGARPQGRAGAPTCMQKARLRLPTQRMSRADNRYFFGDLVR